MCKQQQRRIYSKRAALAMFFPTLAAAAMLMLLPMHGRERLVVEPVHVCYTDCCWVHTPRNLSAVTHALSIVSLLYSTSGDVIDVAMETTTARSINCSVAMTVAGARAMTGVNYVDTQPPMWKWNESQYPYLGDLTPKPVWEIILKVRDHHHHHHHLESAP